MEEAHTALISAVELDPSGDTALANLGDVYAKLATIAYERACRINPDDRRARDGIRLLGARTCPRASRNRQRPWRRSSPWRPRRRGRAGNLEERFVNVAFLLLTVLSMLGRLVVRRRTSDRVSDSGTGAAAHSTIRRSIRSANWGFNSTPTRFLPRSRAASRVVPDPAWGSGTTSPQWLVIATHRRASVMGMTAGWPSCPQTDRFRGSVGMSHVVRSRRPLGPRTAPTS